MLKRLYIRNYALIDELSIDFSEGLTIITGETGAGKSILLGALGLIMGERADSKIFYNKDEKCIVEGAFEVSSYDLRAFFDENELDYDHEVLIRREISPAGKSRAFINDTPVNNQLLQRLTEALVDIHQQFDVLDIHHVNFQLRMLDALADNSGRLKPYQEAFRRYVADQKHLADLIERNAQSAREMDFLKFQLEELHAASLESGEQNALEAELAQLSHAEDIKRVYGAALDHLIENDQNIYTQLQELARSMQALSRISAPLKALSERMENVLVEVQDLGKECERIAEQTDLDPARLQEVNERLNLVYKLEKKHGLNTVEDLLALQQSLEEKLGGFADLGKQIADLEQSIARQEKTMRAQALELRSARRKIIPGFEQRVHEMLALLSMPEARLQVEMEESEKLGSSGLDEVRFLFASNRGSRFLPIKDVASGGELSRLTLCTKSLVADAIPLPTLIFDEIDTGISGDVSLKMGQILRELSARHQVVCITHTPQVAAKAHKHYFVFKKTEGDRTYTHVRLLSDDDRVRSLGIMLSGNPPSEAALVTARELVAL